MSRAARLLAVLTLIAVALFSARSALAASKIALPPLNGHVVDTSGTFGADDIRYLDEKLESFRLRSGFAIVALVVGPLQDEPIEDVAYDAFNTWQIGEKGKDNGVLLVVAPSDRRVRIETGKGVGGALTDIQSNDIIRNVMTPPLQAGKIRDAVEAGSDAIATALVQGTPGATGPSPAPGAAAPPMSPLSIAAAVVVGIIVIVLLIVSPAFRSVFFALFQMFLIFGGRGGRGGGGGGGGGSGYSGGGGRSGGGGSSDGY